MGEGNAVDRCNTVDRGCISKVISVSVSEAVDRSSVCSRLSGGC
jgi:hypothetical protein